MTEKRRYDWTFARCCLIVTAVVVLVILLFVRLNTRSGTASSLQELKRMVEIGDGLDAFPFVGEIHWEESTIRQRQVRLTGTADVPAFHRWAFGPGRHPDVGLEVISEPQPKWAIGRVGDRYYGLDRESSGLYCGITVLTDGRFLILIAQPEPIRPSGPHLRPVE